MTTISYAEDGAATVVATNVEQREIYAYNQDGKFEGMHVATTEQFAATGLVEGDAPDVVISTDPRDYNLTPRQFNRFAALHGYDDAIDIVLAALKQSDRETYAVVKGDVVGAKAFHFDVVMGLIGNAELAAFIPESLDVSEETMAERWLVAKDY
jgi:hypothetical protein